jgi:hypothetical protein
MLLCLRCLHQLVLVLAPMLLALVLDVHLVVLPLPLALISPLLYPCQKKAGTGE